MSENKKIIIPNHCSVVEVCPFHLQDEDGIAYCNIYYKSWEISDVDYKNDMVKKPSFCKAKYVEVIE